MRTFVGPASTPLAPLRLLALGDIGRSDAFHVGDEAMMHGLIDAARCCGVAVEWTLMSAEPSRSADRFGVKAVPKLTFEDCDGPADRERRLSEIDQVLQSPPECWSQTASARWREALGAIAGSDAVVLAGGGNIARSWPELVFERAAVARAARRAGRPVAVTGQTIGPSFDPRTRELAAEILAGCVFVGMREEHSYELALELGAPRARTVLQFDDAVCVAGVAPPGSSDIVGDGDFIAVTLNVLGDPDDPLGIVPMLADQLCELGRRTGAAIVLVPHVGDVNGDPAHDVAMARAIVAAARDSAELRIAPLPSSEEAVWLCEQAQLVVSTRYHPVVFAVATATPALFLYQDHYTLVKGQGALALAGLGSWSLPVGLAASGLFVPAALELWNRRHEVRAHLREVAPAAARACRQHVAALLSSLRPDASEPIAVERIATWHGPAARGEWMERAYDGLAQDLRDRDVPDGYAAMVKRQLASASDYAQALTREVGRKEAELALAQRSLMEMKSAADQAHLSWQAERESMQRQLELVEQRAAAAEQWAGVLAGEVERKEADLVIAHAALEVAARREG